MNKTVYNGRFIRVEEQSIDSYVWEKVYLPDSLVIYPIEGDEIYLIVEKRPHEKSHSRLKFVTGHIDQGEDVLDCANREMQEEIGLKAQSLIIAYHHQSSGTLNSNFYMIEATNLSKHKLPNPDGEDTILAVKKFKLDDVYKMIFNHEITWGLSCLGFLKVYHKKRASLETPL